MYNPTRDELRRREFRKARVRRNAEVSGRRGGVVLYLHPGAEGNERGKTTMVIHGPA
jgi:hypothetical protein